MMKKIDSLLLAFIFVFATSVFVGCSDDSGSSANGNCELDDSCHSGDNGNSSADKNSSSSMGPLDVLVTGGSGYEGTITYGGQTYKTVRIGKQKWFAENLNYNDPENEFMKDSTFCYENKEKNCSKYGRMYSLTAAMKMSTYAFENTIFNTPSGSRGVCPEGWHVPNANDWNDLGATVSGCIAGKIKPRNHNSDDLCPEAGIFLSVTDGWMRRSLSGEFVSAPSPGTNPYDFSAAPFGFRTVSGKDTLMNVMASWWVVSRMREPVYINAPNGGFMFGQYPELGGFHYVRCLNDTLFHDNAIDPRDPRIPPKLTNEVDPSGGDGSFGTITYAGKTYKTVQIGSQVWFAENLGYFGIYNTMNEDAFYPFGVKDSSKTLGLTYSQWSDVMNLSIDYNDTSGYDYGVIDDVHQGICPKGWHIPKIEEFDTLRKYVADSVVNYGMIDGGTYGSSNHLMSKNEWYNDQNGIDDYGFNVRPMKDNRACFWAVPDAYNYEDYHKPCLCFYDNHVNPIYREINPWGSNSAYDINSPAVRCLNDRTFPIKRKPATTVKEEKIKAKTAWEMLNPNITYGTVTDARDKQVYKTVKIGNQTWFAQNLNYVANFSGCYKDSQDSCAKYGRLYEYRNLRNISQIDICPDGWHTPKYEEWDKMFTTVVGEDSVYKESYMYSKYGNLRALKSLSGWHQGENGTDDYGFCALPAGVGYKIDSTVDWSNASGTAGWWTEDMEQRIVINYNSKTAEINNVNSSSYELFSIRCVQDTVVVPAAESN